MRRLPINIFPTFPRVHPGAASNDIPLFILTQLVAFSSSLVWQLCLAGCGCAFAYINSVPHMRGCNQVFTCLSPGLQKRAAAKHLLARLKHGVNEMRDLTASLSDELRYSRLLASPRAL